MSQTASPLDQNTKVFAFVKAGLERGDGPSTIAAELEDKHGVTTTKDSIRRFRERHGIAVVKKVKSTKAKVVKPTKAEAVVLEAPKTVFQYSIIEQDGERCITVFVPGETPRVADSTHPNYEAMVEKAKAQDISVFELFDTEKTIRENFERLSDRVLVRGGHIYFDGDEMHNTLTDHILRVLEEGLEDWQPLVAFMEKIMDNPVAHSRKQLYSWLDSHDFSITESGDIIAYKGVRTADEDNDHQYLSLHQGHAIVDGDEVYDQQVPQSLGSIVEMPRQEVIHEPDVSCSVGLHIGTFPYAKQYGDVVLEVHVNPRDVVSVPNNEGEKARTCRYVVISEITAPKQAAVVISFSEEEPEDDDSECEEHCEHCEHYYDGVSCCWCGK